jgi:hypothetical protein
LFDGALAVDATVGNGYDTSFLAHRVGSRGTVLGSAIRNILDFSGKSMLRNSWDLVASAPSPFSMIRIGLLPALACFASVAGICVTAASEFDGSKPYGEVCLSVRDEAKFVIAHATASGPCVLLVVAFNQDDRRLAYGWHPEFAEMGAESPEVTLPEKSLKWNWKTNSKPFDIYVLFLSPSSPVANQIKSLVAAMQCPNEKESLVRLQTSKLHELLSDAVAKEADSSKRQEMAKPTEVGGVIRGPDVFRWEDFAVKVNFDERNPGLLVFQSGVP